MAALDGFTITEPTNDDTDGALDTPPQAKTPQSILKGFDIGTEPEETTVPTVKPEPEPVDNSQFSVFGTALPGTPAAKQGKTMDPRTAAVLHNLDIVDSLAIPDAARNEIVAETLKVPVSVVQSMHPTSLQRALERQDVIAGLERARETRERMAVDLEAAAVLYNQIKPLAASEKAIERLGAEIRPPFKDFLHPLPSDTVSRKAGIVRAVGRSLIRMQINSLVDDIETAMATATDSEKAIEDVFRGAVKDVGIGFAEGLAPGSNSSIIGSLIFDAIPRVFRRLTTDETDADKLRASAKEMVLRAAAKYNSMNKLGFSDAAMPFFRRVDEINKDAGFLDTGRAMMMAIAEDPLAALQGMTEILVEQAIPIGLSIAGTRLTGRPLIGGSIMASAAYIQERFQLPVEFIKKEFGIDITTAQGAEAFIKSPQMQERAKDFLHGRGIPIALGASASIMFARVRLARSALGNVALQTPFQAVEGFTSEVLAQIFSDGNIILSEAFLEGLAEAHPGQVTMDILIANADDGEKRADKKKMTAFLKGSEELSVHVKGIDTEALKTASEVLGEKLKSEGVEEIFLSAEEVIKFNQDNEGDIIETLGLTAEEVQRAADEGLDVQISVESFVRHILGKEGFDALIKHTRTEVDGFTPAEAAEFEEAGGEAAILKELETKAMERLTTALGVEEDQLQDFIDDGEAIKSDVSAQLAALDKFSGERANLMAMLTAQRYVVRAVRATKATGTLVRALDLYLQDNPQIRGEVDQQAALSFQSRDRAGLQAFVVQQDVINLDDARTMKHLEETHADFMLKVQERVAAKQEEIDAHEWSIEVGEKFQTEDGIRKGHPPWTVVSRTIKKKGLSPDAKPSEGDFTQIDNVPYLFVEDGQGTTTMIPEWAIIKRFTGPQALDQAPTTGQVSLRIQQLAFESDVRSGQVVVTPENITEVNQLREQFGLEPLDVTPTTPIGFEQAGFQPVGTPLPPKVADPTPAELKKAKASTDRSGAAVSARLPIIIPESGRVAQSPYTVGHPDGRSWTDLTDAELDVRGAGVTLTQADLDGIMEGVLKDVSKAAQDAVESTGAAFQLTPEQLDRALKLSLRAQLWYELSGEMFKVGLPSLTFEEHFMFLDLVGATSARAKPFDNLARSLAVLSQFKRGVPIDTDLAMPTAVTKALGRGGKDVTNLTGNKTGQFSNTMALTAGMETSYPIPVNDVWVGVMFGITDEQLSSNQSLHEVMALYQIRLAEMVRAKGNSGTSVPHQPWHIQARGWVQLRSEDAGIDTATAEKVEGNDYAAEWPRIIKLLRDAGVPGISKDGVLSEKALMSPLFIDAIRPTVKGWRDAPKATVEAGTLLTTKGRHAADLVEAGLAVGDTLTESKYYAAIMSSLSKMSLKTFKQSSLLPLLRSIADGTFDISRMQTGTKDRPFDVAGWFEGRLSPNIRIPLQALSTENFLTDPETGELRWSEISVFNAVVGKALSQAAMATSEVLPVNAAEPARNGYTHGLSVFVRDNAGVTPEQLKSFAEALPEGFGLSSYTLPGGVVIDINPRYDPSTDSLVGIEDAALEPAIDALGVPKGVAGTLDHDFRSVYDEASEYDVIIEQFIKSVKAKATEQLMAVEKTVIRKVKEKDKDGKTITKEVEEVIRLDPAVAAAIADAASPVASVARRKIPASIRGRVSTVAKALEGRLSNFATGQQGYTDLAQDLETTLEKDFGRAAKRIEKAGGTAPVLQQAEQAIPLEQDAPQGPRGSFTPSDKITDQDGNPINLIQIFEKGDPSTFLHESGHFWLEQLKDDAARFKDTFEKDWGTVKKWWGQNALNVKEEALVRAKKAKDKDAVAALEKMTEAQVKTFINTGNLRGEGTERYLSVAMHEQFARGVENYFRDGKAPSIALADAFISFAQWIKSVYRRMAGLDIQFSPEVTAVLDRMLATDEEIELAFSQYELTGLFDTAKEAGVSPKKFAEMQQDTARAKEASKANQLAKYVKEIERVRLKWWTDERENLREDVRASVAQQPVYQLVWALTQGGLADGSTLPPELLVNRMEKRALEALLPEGVTLKSMPRQGRAIYEIGKKEGDTASPEAVAAAFGFGSTQQMIEALVDLPSYTLAVESELDNRMKAAHGDMDQDAEVEAIASVHNDPVANLLAAELEALRTTEKALKPAFLKIYAKQRILESTVTEARQTKFLSAEKKHAKAAGVALKKGDRAEAYAHQFKRLLNHYMATEAMRFQKNHAKQMAYLRSFKRTRKKFPGIDADYVTNIRKLVNAYDFGPRRSAASRAKAELKAINDFIIAQQKDEAAIFDIPAWLLDESNEEHIRDITVGRFNELHDSVKQLEKQGKNKKRLLVGQERADRNLTIARMRTALAGTNRALTNRLRDKFVSPDNGGVLYSLAGFAARIDASLLKVEQLLEAIDGQPMGVWHQTLYQPFADAEGRKQELNGEVTDLINGLMAALPKEVRKSMGKPIDVGELGDGRPWTRGNVIMLALNSGNESNMHKLVEGYKTLGWNISEELVDDVIGHLTTEEMDLVQAVWDHSEKLWPTVESIYRKENGVSPDRVEPRKFHHKGKDYAGGYFPMFYDTSLNEDGKGSRLESLTALEMMQANVGRAAVNSSMTKSRTGFVAPVSLDITKMGSAFDMAIHYITHYPAVQNARRVLTDPDLRKDLEGKVGKAYANELDDWIGALASNGHDKAGSDWADNIVGTLTTNTTIAVLGLSYSTLGAQTLGLLTTYDRLTADDTYGPLGHAHTLRDMAYGIVMSTSLKHHEAVFALSTEMRFRLKNTDRELRAGMRRLAGKKDIKSRTQQGIMLMIAGAQLYTVDMPAWTAAYSRALRADPADVKGAVNYADRVVRISQSGGGLKDLAAFQRHGGIRRAITMFYSFFSVLYGILRQIGSEVVKKPRPMTILRGMSRIFIVLTLQELGMALIRGELPNLEPEDEDKEGMLKYLAKQTLLAATATVPLGRDIASGAIESKFGYSPTPLSMFGENLSQSIQRLVRVADEEDEAELLDLKTIKPLIMVFGTLAGLPATQVNRTLDGWIAKMDEEDGWSYLDLLRGYDEDRAQR